MCTIAARQLRLAVLSAVCALAIMGFDPTGVTVRNFSAPSAPTPTPAKAWFGASISGIELGSIPGNGGIAGVRLDWVVTGGPADAAGMREGDIVVTFDGRPASTMAALLQTIDQVGPKKTAPVKLLRDGKWLTVSVTLIARPADLDQQLRADLVARVRDRERDGAAMLATGREREAFGQYVAALRLIDLGIADYHLDSDADFDADLARLGQILPRLRPPPAIPAEAAHRMDAAIAILRAAKNDDDDNRAISELAIVAYQAPWLADVFRNEGLVMAKVGRAAHAVTALRRYLLLVRDAAEAEAIQQKLNTLEPVAEDQKPWLRFVGEMNMRNGDVERLTLRNRDLAILVIRATPGSNQKVGDVVCWGQVHGRLFQGNCNYASNKPEFVACFGHTKRYDADGGIEGNLLVIRSVNRVHYFSDVCAITTEERGTLRTIPGREYD